MELSFPFELKSVTEAGLFEGLASTYGNVDRGGDVCEPGCFTKSLATGGMQRPILWAHDMANPVGLGTLVDSAAGLMIKGELDLDTQSGRDAYSRLKKGIVRGLSIGYSVTQKAFEGSVRKLKEIEHEGVMGAVIGRAIYEGKFTLAEALKIARA